MVVSGAGETVRVSTELDVGRARRTARALAEGLGFDIADAERVALAVSELGMNLVRHAGGGEIALTPVAGEGRSGLRLECRDGGPGIADTARAMGDGFSTGGGLGGGLGGVRRLMDEFELVSSPAGTRVVAVKWLAQGGERAAARAR